MAEDVAIGLLYGAARRVAEADRMVDEKAPETGSIAGAGLGVFALDPRFLTLGSVVLAPPSASLTRGTRAAPIERMLAAISAFREGREFLDGAARAG